MEIPNSKQQQLTFDKGITNVPSDAICSDNTLEVCEGLTFDNAEHRIIQNPHHLAFSITGTLLFVHHHNSEKRFIIRSDNGITWTEDGIDYHNILNYNGNSIIISAVGKTLVIATDNGLTYAIWKPDAYLTLGNNLPDIKVIFRLNDRQEYQDKNMKYLSLGDAENGPFNGYYINIDGYAAAGNAFKEGRYEEAKTGLVAIVSQRLAKVREEKRFAFPFWARFALRLYDGSHVNISNPFLLLPSVMNNWKIFAATDNGGFKDMDENAGGWAAVNYLPTTFALQYMVSTPSGVNIDDWTDIIKGIDVFVSQEVRNFDADGDWTILNLADDTSPTQKNPLFGTAVLQDFCSPYYGSFLIPYDNTWSSDINRRTYYQPALLSQEEMKQKLIEASAFYKVFELSPSDIKESAWKNAADKMTKFTLKNLTTQTQLEYDDFFGRTAIIPSIMKTYNGRLHMADVTRGFFSGFSRFSFSSYNNPPSPCSLQFYVFIRTDSGDRVVTTTVSSEEIEKLWFYYPDPRAYKVKIYVTVGNTEYLRLDADLKEHPFLHGAYFFGTMPDGTQTPTNGSAENKPTVNVAPEEIRNQLIVSEVNNPFVFTASGYVSIATGAIVGLASQVMSLGENEHGLHPLTVFSERGISLLRVSDTGSYARADEISREVCNKPESIIETDGPVFFSSAKGLMKLSGSQVSCVSLQLNGMAQEGLSAIVPVLSPAFIAYDYRDSLLWLFDGTSNVAWVFELKSQTFSTYRFSAPVTAVVNDYPDMLIQMGTSLLSLINRPNINSDQDSYSAVMRSRPLKFENAFALKKLIQIMHASQMRGNFSLRIFASNNLRQEPSTWVEIHSLNGTPWKYYKFQYDFSNLRATDRFAGSVVVTQEVRTDKLR